MNSRYYILYTFPSHQLLEINFLWTNFKQPVVNIKNVYILLSNFCLLSAQQFPHYVTCNECTSFNSYPFFSQTHFRRLVSVMKSSVMWDTMTCSSVKANWCFRRTYHLHLQGWKAMQARYQHEADIMKSKSEYDLRKIIALLSLTKT